MMADRDQLFKSAAAGRTEFEFNDQVARVFDDMVLRSIPQYLALQDLVTELVCKYVQPGSFVCDVGCATGFTIRSVYRRLKEKQLAAFRLLGIDNSPAMLEQAKSLFNAENPLERCVSFKLEDLLQEPELIDASVVMALFVFQFIKPAQRKATLKHIYQSLASGGAFIFAERTISNNPTINQDYLALYHAFKRKNGYTETEIMAKQAALTKVLFPLSDEENIAMAKECGFEEVELAWKWLNFSCYLAIKK